MYILFKNFKKQYGLETDYMAKKYLQNMTEGVHYFVSPLNDIFVDKQEVEKFMTSGNNTENNDEIDISKYLL